MVGSFTTCCGVVAKATFFLSDMYSPLPPLSLFDPLTLCIATPQVDGMSRVSAFPSPFPLGFATGRGATHVHLLPQQRQPPPQLQQHRQMPRARTSPPVHRCCHEVEVCLRYSCPLCSPRGHHADVSDVVALRQLHPVPTFSPPPLDDGSCSDGSGIYCYHYQQACVRRRHCSGISLAANKGAPTVLTPFTFAMRNLRHCIWRSVRHHVHTDAFSSTPNDTPRLGCRRSQECLADSSAVWA